MYDKNAFHRMNNKVDNVEFIVRSGVDNADNRSVIHREIHACQKLSKVALANGDEWASKCWLDTKSLIEYFGRQLSPKKF